MRRALVLLAFTLVPSPAAAQTNVPPPPRRDDPSFAKVLGITNDATGLAVSGGLSAMERTSYSVRAGNKAGKVFGNLGYALSASEIANKLERGDTPGVIEDSAMLATDVAVDRFFCGSEGPVFELPCSAAYSAGKFIGQGIDHAYSSWTGRSIGADLYDITHPAENFDPRDSLVDIGSQQKARFAATRQTNEDAQIAAAEPPSGPAYEPAGPDPWLSALTAINSSYLKSPRTQAPAMESSPTGGPCHPGHDEQAHPGGCHESPTN